MIFFRLDGMGRLEFDENLAAIEKEKMKAIVNRNNLGPSRTCSIKGIK